MNKKALEMAMGTIVAIVLGLIVLIILIIFVQQQVSKSSTKLGEIEKEADYAADKCQSIIKGTFCTDECKESEGYKPRNSPTGKWKDCDKICCGKGEA